LIISHQKKSKDSLVVNGKIEQNNQKDVSNWVWGCFNILSLKKQEHKFPDQK
jgi:hypothetical protein